VRRGLGAGGGGGGTWECAHIVAGHRRHDEEVVREALRHPVVRKASASMPACDRLLQSVVRELVLGHMRSLPASDSPSEDTAAGATGGDAAASGAGAAPLPPDRVEGLDILRSHLEPAVMRDVLVSRGWCHSALDQSSQALRQCRAGSVARADQGGTLPGRLRGQGQAAWAAVLRRRQDADEPHRVQRAGAVRPM